MASDPVVATTSRPKGSFAALADVDGAASMVQTQETRVVLGILEGNTEALAPCPYICKIECVSVWVRIYICIIILYIYA